METPKERSGITVFSITGVVPEQRESVRGAIAASGRDLPARYEAWVVGARRPPAYIVRVIGPGGFYREEKFSGREPAVEITRRVQDAVRGGRAYAGAAAV
jgi:hypothetical protein